MNQPISNRARVLAPLVIPALGLIPDTGSSATPAATPENPTDLPVEQVAVLTGPDSSDNTGERWSVYGTDLGHSFMHKGEMFIVFGDTFATNKSDWRSNVAAVTTDDEPGDGITFNRMITDRDGHAKELLPSKKVDFDEMTVIPTYGVSIGDRMFLHYMSVQHWGEPGHWDLGMSGYAWSDDDGQTWTKDRDATWPGDSNFGQVALEEHDGHIYIFGISGGRYGGVHLARTPPGDILLIETYEYWTGSAWTTDSASAATIVPPNVGELSVRWNSFYNRWIMMYLNDPEGTIEVRVADEITGPWSEPFITARSKQFPSLYAPYQFPQWNDTADIYFAMSLFGPYQVFLMKTEIPALMP